MRKNIFTIIIIILYLIVCYTIYNRYTIKEIKTITTTISKSNTTIPKKVEKPIGYLEIKKLNINQPLYSPDSKHNNVEENITILNYSEHPKIENSIMFIAAHSGTGKIAYFEELDNLIINDEVTLYYDNQQYNYVVKNIWDQIKNGSISVTKENTKQLVLTTCSPTKKNYQLIINCVEKK